MKKEDDFSLQQTNSNNIEKVNGIPATDNSESIGAMIMEFRGQQVMIDRDLARLYGVTTKVLNQAVKRNIERFPGHFRFQLSVDETNKLVTDCDRLKSLVHSSVLPYAFTEQGVAMLSTVLHSDTAVEVSIQIIDAFVIMRHHLRVSDAQIFHRFENMEQNQMLLFNQLSVTNDRIDEVFRRLDNGHVIPSQGIFFDGQVFDAHRFVSDLIRGAKRCVVLFDNYVDDTTLAMLDKRVDGVKAIIYTRSVTPSLRTDVLKHDTQYPPIEVHEFAQAHDRFLCIDDTVYHIGASLKDLGKKWFAFSRMEIPAGTLLGKMQE